MIEGMNFSRAAAKLSGALQSLKVDFKAKTVLDIGASTGGFTQLALKMGAKKVIAVEKGTKQMRAELARDSRVELHEKQDIFKYQDQRQIDIVLADVSFVSLRKILNYAKKEFQPSDYVVLLKPQFEAAPWQLEKGIVKNKKMRREIIFEFEQWLKRSNFKIMKAVDSGIAGRYGNVERIYWLKNIDA